MKSKPYRFFIGVAIVLQCSCSTITGLGLHKHYPVDEYGYYPGTCWDAKVVAFPVTVHMKKDLGQFDVPLLMLWPFFLADLPLSAVSETLLIPYHLINSSKDGKSLKPSQD
ncbi:MAG: hypothetical protein ACU88J_15735 [Gammaproteobacteria bacterium]